MEVKSTSTELSNAVHLTLNPRQVDFFYCTDQYPLYGGAKGGGKSWAIRTRQLVRRLTYPGSRGLLLRRTYPELKRTHIDKIAIEWKIHGTFNKQEKVFHFHNGSSQEFGSCQYESNVSDYQGAEYDDIGIDEATQFTEFMIETFKTNIRTVRTDLKPQIYLGANPGGVGHGYIKRKWVSAPREEGHAFIPAKVYDNHVLMESNPEYVKQLERLPETLRRAFLDGDWNIFEGQALSEWRLEKHITNRFPVSLEACKKIICFDWGYSAPGCALWLAFAPENQWGVRHIYCYRELYQNQKTPEEWARQIGIFTRLERTAYMVLPHDCYSNIQGKPSIESVFRASFGQHCPIVAGKTLQTGARHLRLAMLHDKLADAIDEPERIRTPYLQIHEKCVNTVRTLPELVYDDHDPEDIDTDGEDHSFDALSLGIMTEVTSSGQSGPVGSTPVKRTAMYPTFQPNQVGTLKVPDFMHGLASHQKKIAKGR